MAKKRGTGRIIKIYNNYGIISSSSFNKEGIEEEFPFQITKDMILEEDGVTYVNYFEYVSFSLNNADGIRRQGRIIEAIEIQGQGELLRQVRQLPNQNYVRDTIEKLKMFNFDVSDIEEMNDTEIYEYFKIIDFQPRMRNYLVDGVFISKTSLNLFIPEGTSVDDFKLKPQIIVVLDKIDQTFRLYLMEWVLQIENAIKSYISRVLTDQNARVIVSETLDMWKRKKGTKHIEKARIVKQYRRDSDSYDYILNEFAPIEDILDQLDLTELREFINYWYEACKGRFMSRQLELIKHAADFFPELSVLRNASAHGRSIIAGFMDPDFNANWDMEFDNLERRTKIKSWVLYEILEQSWIKRGVDSESIPQRVQTIYGNSYRRSWVTLNYIFMKLISFLDPHAFGIFREQADFFLKYPLDIEEHFESLRNVNLLNLRLFHMGFTTMEQITGIPAPYKEIANEAFFIWEHYMN
ncbi:Abi family protein [Streptococcus suis]|uniref:Abi family protein n=1 Tax=Streptococcus suis TaxID=1307 RepID=UPI002AADD031|nr:Abi family protein [Streptococcus suis]HEM4584639.1 Abi family protein [Streptococcus suis]